MKRTVSALCIALFVAVQVLASDAFRVHRWESFHGLMPKEELFAAYADADFIIVAAPTNYDSKQNYFDTSAVEDVIETVLRINPNAIIIIKSTVPVGYTDSVREKYGILCTRKF